MYTICLTEVGGGQNLTKLFKNGYLTTSCLLSHHGRGAYLKSNKKFFLQYPNEGRRPIPLSSFHLPTKRTWSVYSL